MTLNELRIKCIKKTEMADDQTLTAANFPNLVNNGKYKDFALNVTDSINDALTQLVNSDRIPYKTLTIQVNSSGISSISRTDYPTLSGAREIKKCFFREETGNSYVCDFNTIDGTIYFDTTYCSGTMFVFYSPVVPTFTLATDGNTDLSALGINDLMCTFISYFAKADLYEKQEPDIAIQYRSIASQYGAMLQQDISLPAQRQVREVIKLL